MASIAQTRVPRTQATLLALLLAAAVLAWILTRNRMLGMDAGPGTDPGTLGFYVISWVVMMAGMMFPSIAPMVLTFSFIQRRRHEREPIDRTVSASTFIAGYLVTWTAFGLAAYGLYVGLRSLSIPAFSWHRAGPYVAAGVILAAAIYQLTPAKDACLRRCRGPLGFLLNQWREGPLGALRMGIEHGAWCVGCCWALMAALFALGVMSLWWMVVIAALIALEKLFPIKVLANRTVALVLVGLAAAVAFVPNDLPGLTVPGSPAAARAMQRMGVGSMSMGKGPKMHAMPVPGASTQGATKMHGAAMPGMQHGSKRHGAAMPGMQHGSKTQGASKSTSSAPLQKTRTAAAMPGGAMKQPHAPTDMFGGAIGAGH
jgi:predicted metal-binding membrane protein